METTTQFPVDQGTVVEVTCSYFDAVNEGSNRLTCISGTDFTFSKEPSCSIPGLLNKLGLYLAKPVKIFCDEATIRAQYVPFALYSSSLCHHCLKLL